MKMPVVPLPRLHLAEPFAIAPGIAAERLFYRCVHKYARDVRILRRRLDERYVRWCPYLAVHILAVFGTTGMAIISSSSSLVSSRWGMGVSQMSASSPT